MSTVDPDSLSRGDLVPREDKAWGSPRGTQLIIIANTSLWNAVGVTEGFGGREETTGERPQIFCVSFGRTEKAMQLRVWEKSDGHRALPFDS